MCSSDLPNGSITEYLYDDPLNRLTEITNKDSAQAIINKHIFTYNNLDLIDTETITTGTAIDTFTEGLKIYDYNNLNQLLSATNPNETFIYDDDGNMTQGYTPDGYLMTMTYDAENRLTSAEYTDSGSVVHRTEYFYSGDNFLAQIKKYENATLASDTRFIRAEFLPVQERDGNNQVLKEYIWGIDKGGGIGGLLNLNQSGQDYSYLYDGKGNVMALIDNTESVVATYRYDAFGVLKKKAATLDQPYQFSTKRYDELTGLSYYGYRYYSPVLGRWITRDPLGEAGGINLYGFVGNNPVNWIDPWGLSRAVFDPTTNSMYVYPGDTPDIQGPPQRFPASNRTSNPNANPYEPGGYGPAPTGTFPTGNFIETGGNPNSSFGSGFIPINLPQQSPYNSPRTGVGVHAGRANTYRGYGYGTRGCIRTTEDALDAFRNDPLRKITILPRK